MDAVAPPALRRPFTIAIVIARSCVVLWLLLMFPAGLITLAAAGPTLSDPMASYRVGTLVLTYLAFDVVSLIVLALFNARRWPWLFATVVAFAPIVALTRNVWL